VDWYDQEPISSCGQANWFLRARTDIKVWPSAFIRTRTDIKLQLFGLVRSYKD